MCDSGGESDLRVRVGKSVGMCVWVSGVGWYCNWAVM